MPHGCENKASPLARAARCLSPDDVPALIGMTDPVRLPDPEKALAALPSGSILIWRAYGETLDREEVRRVTRVAENRNCLLLLAGYPRLAMHAHGIHLPEHALIDPLTDGYLMDLSWRRPGFIITAAAHSQTAIRRAARRGVDAVLLSPAFPTSSHPGRAHLGIVRMASLAHDASSHGLASYALGGISCIADIRRLQGTGITGIAGIGFLLG